MSKELLARLEVIENMSTDSGIKELCEVIRLLLDEVNKPEPIKGFTNGKS